MDGTCRESGAKRLVALRLVWSYNAMKMTIFLWGRVVGLLACLVLVSCTTVSETGRKQFNILSSAEELQLGLTSFQEMKKEVPVSTNAAANLMLQKVGTRIAAVAPMENAQWEFVLFESKEPNAFCLPGGKVGVYTGILPITKDEAGLATVIGHEVAHAKARHGGERLTTQMALQTGGSVLGAGLSSTDPKVQAAASTIYGLGGSLLYALPHSRTQESEADYMGLLYMARAGYEPAQAVAFWQRFAESNKQAGGEGLWFLRTHPLDSDRIEQIKGWLPQAQKEYRPAP